ncbi:hypothetical protein [Streptomyces sp. NPDC050416]
MTTVAPGTKPSVLIRRPDPGELHPARTHHRRRAARAPRRPAALRAP